MDTQILDNKKNVIELFIRNEEALSALYARYSTIFADDSDFWMDISKDETVHASWVHDLLDKYLADQVNFSDNRFSVVTISNMVDYVKSETDKALPNKVNPIQALSISMDIENSMLERNMFEAYDSDDFELKDVLDKLRTSTEIHYAEVKKRWELEKSSNSQQII